MLEHLRQMTGLTQRDLATRARVTQETVSQLENGKVERPRLDTLIKLCAALDLPDMQPRDLLEPCPLYADPEVGPAVTRLVGLLKVLPPAGKPDRFWETLAEHLDYRDDYPARSIAAHLDLVQRGERRSWAADLAEYTLMFFNPDDDTLVRLLDEAARIGPTRWVARRWCQDVTEAAWVIHRAALSSYPEQVGRSYQEALETDDPKRLAELAENAYDIVRVAALARCGPAAQIRALQADPSVEVVYQVAEAGGADVQWAALRHPRAWPGLASNPELTADVADQLLQLVLPAARNGEQAEAAGNALNKLAGRRNFGRPWLERISQQIDRLMGTEMTSLWVISAGRKVRDALAEQEQTAGANEAVLTPRPVAQSPSRWRRFFTDRVS